MYRKLVRDEKILPLPGTATDAAELSSYFRDEVVFEYEKGDVEYFISIYNNIAINLSVLYKQFKALVEDDRWVSELLKAGLLCALSEKLYLGIDEELLVIEYVKLMNNYGEIGTNKIFSKLRSKQAEPQQD